MRGGSWIFRLSDTNSSVPSVAQVVQQGTCRQELTGFMIVVCLEPEAVGNGTMNGGALVVHCAMRGPEGGDVEEVGSGSLDVYEGVGW